MRLIHCPNCFSSSPKSNAQPDEIGGSCRQRNGNNSTRLRKLAAKLIGLNRMSSAGDVIVSNPLKNRKLLRERQYRIKKRDLVGNRNPAGISSAFLSFILYLQQVTCLLDITNNLFTI